MIAGSRLSALDTSFLRVETPAAHMHVAWRGRFRPPLGAVPITLERVRALVAGRLAAAPRFRQRLAFPPAALADPVWVDDPRFAVERHVVRLGGPHERPDRARFAALCDEQLGTPLPRDRPLWSLHVAPCLGDGTLGILMKIHHAMVDGTSALALALLLLDADPSARTPLEPPQAWRPDRPPSGARLAVDALAESGTEPLRAAGRLARAAASGQLAGTLRRTALAVGDDVLSAAPPSFLNAPIGPERALVGHTTPLRPLLDARRRHGVSLNDVALAVVAGAVHDLAIEHGRVPMPLKVMVPVSRRAGEEAGVPGNRIAFVFITLPVHLRKPEARLAAVHSETTAFKASGRAGGGEAMLGAIGLLPGPLQTRAARFASSARMYNLVVSNVPGPRFPIYLLGAECVEALPVIPLSEGHALSVGVFSLHDTLCFSGYADPGALPGIGAFPTLLERAVAALAPRRRRAQRTRSLSVMPSCSVQTSV